MRGIVKERVAAASRTENGPLALRYREVRSRLFLSEMPFGAAVVVANSYSFHCVEDTASMIYSMGPSVNVAFAFGGDYMPDELPIASFDLDLTHVAPLWPPILLASVASLLKSGVLFGRNPLPSTIPCTPHSLHLVAKAIDQTGPSEKTWTGGDDWLGSFHKVVVVN